MEIAFFMIHKVHITLLEWNHDKDHIHIVFKAHPKTENQ